MSEFPPAPFSPVYSNEDYLLQLLVEANLVTDSDLFTAKAAKGARETALEYMLRDGMIKEPDLARTMAVNANMEFVDLSEVVPTPEILDAVPRDIAARQMLEPYDVLC